MRRSRGFSSVEILTSLIMGALLLGSLYRVVDQSMGLHNQVSRDSRTLSHLQFAMDRMVRHIKFSSRVILPLTAGTPRDVFAVALPASVDRDRDGYADADNDRDGLVDEDPGSDMTNDGEAGIAGIDDDADGIVDNGSVIDRDHDDDEDGSTNEDPLNGIDDDGDGRIDEDAHDDQNGDGAAGRDGIDDDRDGFTDESAAADDDEDVDTDEDWIDPVVYRLEGTDLVERLPLPWDVDGDFQQTGRDYVENIIANDVSAFSVTRSRTATADLLELRLTINDAQGQAVNLTTTVRVGGAL
jgi:hypothetical protein